MSVRHECRLNVLAVGLNSKITTILKISRPCELSLDLWTFHSNNFMGKAPGKNSKQR